MLAAFVTRVDVNVRMIFAMLSCALGDDLQCDQFGGWQSTSSLQICTPRRCWQRMLSHGPQPATRIGKASATSE